MQNNWQKYNNTTIEITMQQLNDRPHTHISLQFTVICNTNFGQEVRICGNSMELGNWNPLLGHRLVTDDSLYPRWKSFVPLILKNINTIQYKACIIANNRVTWERNVANREINCTHPSSIEFEFNQVKESVNDRQVTEIECKEGTFDILQDMQGSQTSSVQFKSNYPLECYFMPSDHDSLGMSRAFSRSDLSSNLISPNQGRAESEEFDQDDLEFDLEQQETPELFRTQRKSSTIVRSNDCKGLYSTQKFQDKKSLSRSGSGQKSESRSPTKFEEPKSPYMVHVPIVEVKSPKFKNKQEILLLPLGPTECSETYEQNQEDDKSNSTVIEYDTEDDYLTNRESDVVIEKVRYPNYQNV